MRTTPVLRFHRTTYSTSDGLSVYVTWWQLGNRIFRRREHLTA